MTGSARNGNLAGKVGEVGILWKSLKPRLTDVLRYYEYEQDAAGD